MPLRWCGGLTQQSCPKNPKETGGGPARHVQGRSSLVIDDDDLVRDAHQRAPEAWNYHVLTTQSAATALEDLDGERPILIISDYRFPTEIPGLRRSLSFRAALGARFRHCSSTQTPTPNTYAKSCKAGFTFCTAGHCERLRDALHRLIELRFLERHSLPARNLRLRDR